MRIEPPSKERAARYDAIVCKSPAERARSGEIGTALGVAALLFFVRRSSSRCAAGYSPDITRERNRHARASDIDSREGEA
jgi:hypothetical protein